MLLIFFILGLIIGSFLNVVVYRLQVAQSLWGRSFCPHCKIKIAWYDNIPLISFVLLKFQCRKCKKKISWQYPAVEFFTGVVFALIGWKFFDIVDMQSYLITVYYLGIVSFLIAVFVYDWLYMEIPSLVLWIGGLWAIAFNIYFDLTKTEKIFSVLQVGIFSGMVAAAVAFAFFFALVYFSKEKWMGMGDALLVIFLGLFLGWPQILVGLFLAFNLGAFYSIFLLLIKKRNLKSQIPFGPFLVLGSVITILFYDIIMRWYLGLY